MRDERLRGAVDEVGREPELFGDLREVQARRVGAQAAEDGQSAVQTRGAEAGVGYARLGMTGRAGRAMNLHMKAVSLVAN